MTSELSLSSIEFKTVCTYKRPLVTANMHRTLAHAGINLTLVSVSRKLLLGRRIVRRRRRRTTAIVASGTCFLLSQVNSFNLGEPRVSLGA